MTDDNEKDDEFLDFYPIPTKVVEVMLAAIPPSTASHRVALAAALKAAKDEFGYVLLNLDDYL